MGKTAKTPPYHLPHRAITGLPTFVHLYHAYPIIFNDSHPCPIISSLITFVVISLSLSVSYSINPSSPLLYFSISFPRRNLTRHQFMQERMIQWRFLPYSYPTKRARNIKLPRLRVVACIMSCIIITIIIIIIIMSLGSIYQLSLHLFFPFLSEMCSGKDFFLSKI